MEIQLKTKKLYLCVILLMALFSFVFIYQIFISNNIQISVSKIGDSENNVSFSDDSHTTSSNDQTSASDNSPTDDSDNRVSSKTPPKVAITFDDGPHPKYTLKLLDGLKERNVKATFFVIGENVANNPEVIKRIASEGHLIGNHTYSHVQLTCISEEKAISEINKTSELITSYTGVSLKFIRPPYGMYSDALKRETNLTPVLWTVDPRDWSVLNTDSVVKHVLKCVKDGDIILLHDIFDTSVEAAFQIIDNLKAQGYEFVTVDELCQS